MMKFYESLRLAGKTMLDLRTNLKLTAKKQWLIDLLICSSKSVKLLPSVSQISTILTYLWAELGILDELVTFVSDGD